MPNFGEQTLTFQPISNRDFGDRCEPKLIKTNFK